MAVGLSGVSGRISFAEWSSKARKNAIVAKLKWRCSQIEHQKGGFDPDSGQESNEFTYAGFSKETSSSLEPDMHLCSDFGP